MRQAGIGLHQPAPVRDAVGDAQEFVRLHHVVIAEGLFAQDIRVNLGNAVHRVRKRHAQIRHMHLPIAQHGHVANAFPLAGIHVPQAGAQALVHLLQNHVYARHQHAHHVFGPLFQCFGHHRVVGVGKRAVHDVLRALPREALFIQQNAHQLGDRHAGMRVVDVDGDFVREDVPIRAVGLFKIAHDVLHRGAGEEILLLEPQLLALVMVVFGIEHLGDHFAQLALFHGAHIIPAVERLHVDFLGRFGRPGAQHVHHVGVVTQNGHIVGHGEDGGIILLLKAHPAALLPHSRQSALPPPGPGARFPTGCRFPASCRAAPPGSRPRSFA